MRRSGPQGLPIDMMHVGIIEKVAMAAPGIQEYLTPFLPGDKVITRPAVRDRFSIFCFGSGVMITYLPLAVTTGICRRRDPRHRHRKEWSLPRASRNHNRFQGGRILRRTRVRRSQVNQLAWKGANPPIAGFRRQDHHTAFQVVRGPANGDFGRFLSGSFPLGAFSSFLSGFFLPS